MVLQNVTKYLCVIMPQDSVHQSRAHLPGESVVEAFLILIILFCYYSIPAGVLKLMSVKSMIF